MLQVKSRVTVRVVVPRIGRRALKAQCCTCLSSFHGHVLLILVFLLAAWFSGSLLSTCFFKVKIKKAPLAWTVCFIWKINRAAAAVLHLLPDSMCSAELRLSFSRGEKK